VMLPTLGDTATTHGRMRFQQPPMLLLTVSSNFASDR
jgi:hypothetical protein